MTEPALGVLRQVIVPVDEVAAAVEHYREQYGLNPKFVDADWAAFDLGGLTLALASGQERPGAEGPVLAIRVTDLEDAVARLTASGGHAIGAPREGGHERRVEAIDRLGTRLLLYQPHPA